MMNWTKEMINKVDELTDLYVITGEGCENACKHCPYYTECHKTEGWFGCGAWEEGMGEDL